MRKRIQANIRSFSTNCDQMSFFDKKNLISIVLETNIIKQSSVLSSVNFTVKTNKFTQTVTAEEKKKKEKKTKKQRILPFQHSILVQIESLSLVQILAGVCVRAHAAETREVVHFDRTDFPDASCLHVSINLRS